VDIGGGEEAVALDELMPSRSAPGPAGDLLQVVEPCLNRSGMGRFDLGADRKPGERPGQRNRLRRREGEVEAGDSALDLAQPEQIASRGIAAGQHRDELVGLDLAGEAEVIGGVSHPIALGLTLAGVVVLGAFGDLFQVIALLAATELPDGEHQRRPPGLLASWAIPQVSSAAEQCIGSTGPPSAVSVLAGLLAIQAKCRGPSVRPGFFGRDG
jgi:hypothetical protein